MKPRSVNPIWVFLFLMPQLSTAASRRLTATYRQVSEMPELMFFGPNDGGQVDALGSTKRQVWLAGGNKSGKSYILIVKLCYRTLPELDDEGNQTGWLLDPYQRTRIPANGIEAWVSTYSQPVQRETIQPVFDRLLKPYLVPGGLRTEKDTYLEAHTPIANIHFKWQEAKKKSYEGANIHFCACDEPHEQGIYKEILSRFAVTKGSVWVAATLVIDADDPDAWKRLKYVEWMSKVIGEWETDPEKHPELDVVFMDIEENPHADAAEQMKMWSILSEQEKHTRKTGKITNLYGKSWFNKDILDTIYNHLTFNSDKYTPEYGSLEYDVSQDKVHFLPNGMTEFDDNPQGDYTIKVWERPVKDWLTHPQYFIGSDCSKGVAGGDYNADYVIRGDTRAIVAALHGSLDEIEHAKQLWLLGNYYRDYDGKAARLAIEVNPSGGGGTTQAYLITGHKELGIPRYGVTRMYHRVSGDEMDSRLIILGGKPGWLTTGKTRGHVMTGMRQALVEAFRAIAEGRPCPIPDRAVPDEGKTFVMNKNGKYEHLPTKYDDRLFALGIAKRCAERYYRPPKATESGLAPDVKDDDVYYYQNGKVHWNIAAMKEGWNPTKPQLFV